MILAEFTKRQRKANSASSDRDGGETDVRSACQDVRAACISTVILVMKVCPSWAGNHQDMLWDLTTTKLRTPLLFSHALKGGANTSLTLRIIAYLISGLDAVPRYSVKDAQHVISSAGDVCATEAFRSALLLQQVQPQGRINDLGNALLLAHSTGPRLTRGSESDMLEYKLASISAIEKFVAAHVSLLSSPERDISISAPVDGVVFYQEEFCRSFIRIITSEFITLHQASGLRGGPKGVMNADRNRQASQEEAEKLLGSSEGEAIESVLFSL